MLANEWVSLAVVCMLGAFSPGPSLMVILSLTASDGRQAGYIASLGHGLGVFIYAILSATGLSIVLNTHRNIFLTVQVFGAIFLFYLGIRIFRSSLSKNMDHISEDVRTKSIANKFFDGFLIAILNPKIGAFFLSLFSQFLIFGQSLITHLGMATLAGIIDTMAYVIMVSLVSTSTMNKFFSTYKKSVEFSFGLLLIILSISLCLKLIIDDL